MSLHCSEEAFLALVGCVYIVSMTCIQNNIFAFGPMHFAKGASEREGKGKGMRSELMQMTAEK